MSDNQKRIAELARWAGRIRIEALKSIYQAGSGHPGGSFSVAEILAVLYFDQMRIDPKNPCASGRDRLILSKGHAAPTLYAALAMRGYFPLDELNTLRRMGSHLSGHPTCFKTAGVEMTSGSLGQGLSIGLGMRLGARLTGENPMVYVILGDGELQEGQNWEAAMAAAHFKAERLVVVVDYNRVQLDGPVTEIMEVAPLADKWQAFGWEVLRCNGHSVPDLVDTFESAKTLSQSGPVVIIADTVKGKGVSFMEHKAEWHGKNPTEAEYRQALQELESQLEVAGHV